MYVRIIREIGKSLYTLSIQDKKVIRKCIIRDLVESLHLCRNMRLKEIQRTAHQAWSPAGHHPMYLALGTSAQQLDASFNTTAALEIFEVDFSDPSLEMPLRGSLPTANR